MESPARHLPRSVPLTHLLPTDRLLWGTMAVLTGVIIPWGSALSISIHGLPQVGIIIAAVLLLRAGYVVLRPNSQMIHTILETGAALMAYTAVMAPISYFCARNTLPLWNDTFAAVDLAMGYDWHAWANYEADSEILSHVLPAAYASLIPQMIVILVILPWVKGGIRGFTFIRSSIIAAAIACAGSYFLPAAMPEAVHTGWYPHWALLRGSDPFAASLHEMEGIITFPSYHASLAVIFIYSVRGLGLTTWVFVVINVVMLAATTTVGHHYLIDVVAGIAVAAVSIWLAALSNRIAPRSYEGRHLKSVLA